MDPNRRVYWESAMQFCEEQDGPWQEGLAILSSHELLIATPSSGPFTWRFHGCTALDYLYYIKNPRRFRARGSPLGGCALINEMGAMGNRIIGD